ncbi:phosphodiester glycosidase family protein [Candidatus Formimonas warabiya]|uniref:Exopolysaccharide biosynthesis protein n=1 Tax=Formimonas warabiya TaxID=1761012 RepID=A0A3G1L1X3_FORW1|nr:phosphodiester glycosidase family protein [Candidatus Formimonas warabiya]ATW28644.1 exopolysaccharide biosynthesis protein [Candidatus Formimonas warabiya]
MAKFLKNFFLVLMLLFLTGIASLAFVLYGPFTGLRDLYVTSAMTTMQHQYLAKIFFSADKIAEIMRKNALTEFLFPTNVDLIEEENQLPDHIQLIDVSTSTFKGYLLLVSRPERIKVGTSEHLGSKGMKLQEIIEKYHAVGGVNAGGFIDPGGHGTGGVPEGIIIEDGEILYADKSSKYNVIGFTKQNVLVLGKYTLKEIKKLDIRDAVSFRPFIIVNGVPAITTGNGGWGIAPRTAIGQTKDGTVLLLVIDGRQVSSIGATLKDVQDIMLEYGAVNAANLDGGSSSTMYYEEKLINSPSSQYGERRLPSAFIIQ